MEQLKFEIINSERLFQNKYIHNQLKLFNETNLIIAHTSVSSKYITCNDKDADWLNYNINCLIIKKIEIFRMYLKYGRPNFDNEKLQTIKTNQTEVIISSTNSYY